MSVRRGLAWMSLAQAGFFLLQFIGSVIVTRLLTPHDIGVVAIAVAIAGMLSIVQSGGLNRMIVREAELTPQLIATAQTVHSGIAIGLSAAILLLGLVGGRWLADPGVRSCLCVLAALPVIGTIGFLPASMIEREGQFRAIAFISMGQIVASTSVTIILAFAGERSLSIAFGSLAGVIACTAGQVIAGRQHWRFRFGLHEWRRVVRYGGQMLAISGLSDLSNRMGNFMVGSVLGLAMLGLYSRASQLNNLMRDNVQLVIDRVMFVKLAEVKRQGSELRGPYLHAIELMTALLWPLFGGFAVVAGPLILAVYGQNWVGAAGPLSLLCIGSALMASITMAWEIFVLCHETGRQARFEFIRAGLRLCAVFTGCLFGLLGVAAARLFDAALCQYLYRPHLERMTGTTRLEYLRIYQRNIWPTCAAIGPATVLMLSYRWSPAAPLPLVLSSILVGAGAWGLCLRQMDHPAFAELRRLAAMAAPRGGWRLPRRSGSAEA